MAEQTYDKKSIALTQLETALRLFFEGHDLFSVVTLAGASEEIFGKLLNDGGCDNSLDSLKRAANEIHKVLFNQQADERRFTDRANRARNALKHLHAGGSPTFSMDLPQEAKDMLNRAIDNYWLLERSMSSAMQRFVTNNREH